MCTRLRLSARKTIRSIEHDPVSQIRDHGSPRDAVHCKLVVEDSASSVVSRLHLSRFTVLDVAFVWLRRIQKCLTLIGHDFTNNPLKLDCVPDATSATLSDNVCRMRRSACCLYHMTDRLELVLPHRGTVRAEDQLQEGERTRAVSATNKLQ
jgi:hypothetical protein